MASQDRLHKELIDLEDERRQVAARREHGQELAAATEAASWRDATVDRSRRAITEAQQDADEAAKDLALIRGFDRAESPVTSSRRLSRVAKGWRVADIGYSLVGSGLSAVGITATLMTATSLPLGVAAGIAVAAETVLTVRTVDLLGRLSRLDSHDKTPRETTSDRDRDQAARPADRDDDQGSRTHLVIQIGVLLTVSVVLNVIGLAMGAGFLAGLGVAGALLAAMAGLGSHAASKAATDVVRHNLKTWRGANWESRREEMRQRAAGAYIPQRTEDPAVVQDVEEPQAGAAAVDVERIATDTAQQVGEKVCAYLMGRTTTEDDADATELELSQEDTAFLQQLDTQMRHLESESTPGGVAEADHGDNPAPSGQAQHPDGDPSPQDNPVGADQPKRRPGASEVSPDSPAGADLGGRRSASDARAERDRRREERRDQAERLWGEGRSVREIAERMTRDRRTVTEYLRSRGVSIEDIRAREGR